MTPNHPEFPESSPAAAAVMASALDAVYGDALIRPTVAAKHAIAVINAAGWDLRPTAGAPRDVLEDIDLASLQALMAAMPDHLQDALATVRPGTVSDPVPTGGPGGKRLVYDAAAMGLDPTGDALREALDTVEDALRDAYGDVNDAWIAWATVRAALEGDLR